MIVYKTRHRDIPAYETRDGSIIRELMHPDHHAVKNQSLAEARIAPGETTLLHHHQLTEEIYHVMAGEGRMTLDNDQFTVSCGDTILILPGTPHCIENTGMQELVILCCCAPAYSNQDTSLD